MKRTILLFGASGFIGGAIAAHFKKENNITLLTPGRNECNLLQYREVKKYIDSVDPDYVINAAYIEVNSNVKPTRKYLENNLKISNYILKALKGKESVKRIIFFGSGLEYGDSDKPITESHTKNPKNYYAKTKAIQSDASLDLAKHLQLPFILLKPFNLYGPYDNKSVLFYVIKSILDKRPFSVTKGEQIRDILYIEDFLELVEKVLYNTSLQSGEVINAGYGKGIKLQEAVEEIIKQTNYKGTFGIRPYRDNEYFSQIADIHKAKELVRWEPKVKLEQGIENTIAWIKSIDV